jgi:D-amino peptidase
MARVDALYVRHQRGLLANVDAPALCRLVAATVARAPLHGWLLGALARQMGVETPDRLPARAFRRSDRQADLVWLTHLVLLETRYLRSPLPTTGWQAVTEELLLATPELLDSGQLDVAAEVAFCLVAGDEADAPERSRILEALAGHQRPDGSVIEPRSPDPDPRQRFRDETHCTATALLALATAT